MAYLSLLIEFRLPESVTYVLNHFCNPCPEPEPNEMQLDEKCGI